MTADSASDTQTLAVAPATKPKAVPRYALTLLLVIYVLNCLDRQIVNILAEPIREELGLRDWQIGVMTGFSFAIFYASLGVPIARLAERGNRPYIIAGSVVVWSAFTAVCGFAQTFLQLVLARIGVGVGEAGCTPAAHSLISDTVPREKRSSALGFYAMGGPIGSLLGMALGGLIADAWGWRAAFFVAAAPGLLVGALAALTLDEPRKMLKHVRQAAEAAPTFLDAARELRACRTFWLFSIGGAVQGLVAYGHIAFLGSFFFRNHGEELGRAAAAVGLQTAGFLGIAIGLLLGLAGILGAYGGGRLADRYAPANPRWLAIQAAFFTLIGAPIYILAMLSNSAMLALVLLFFPSLFAGMTYGPLFSVIQSIVQPQTRATAVAIYLLMANLVGLGAGPLLVGILSDYLSEGIGLGAAEGLRWAQIAGTMLAFLAAYLYWEARKHIARDTVS